MLLLFLRKWGDLSKSPHKLEAQLEILLHCSLSLALEAGVGGHEWAVGVADRSQIPAQPIIFCVTSGNSLTLSVLLFRHLQI